MRVYVSLPCFSWQGALLYYHLCLYCRRPCGTPGALIDPGTPLYEGTWCLLNCCRAAFHMVPTKCAAAQNWCLLNGQTHQFREDDLRKAI